jgi:HK97 family phage portal protein
MSIKYRTNTKAIMSIPAWAERQHEGGDVPKDTINTTTMAYAYVPLIFRATRLICNSLVSVPVKFYKGEEEVDWPFPDVSLRSLLWKSQAAMCLTGANFIEKMPKKMSRKIGGLQWVNPTTMEKPKLQKTAAGKIDYEFRQKNNREVSWDLSTMIYMREFSLSDDVGPGVSSAGVALNEAALLRYMSRFAARFFETGAMPITVLEIEGVVLPDEALRIEGFFKKAATRIRNAFSVLALSRQIEPKVISQPLKDLVMPELADQARRAVADAFDMHPSLLEEAPNRATATEHRLSLYQDSVEPRAMLLAEEFNHQLLATMGIEMVFAFDEMDIYQEDESERAKSLSEIVSAININPELAAWAMEVLGYDLSEEQEAALQTLISKREKEKEEERKKMEEQTRQAAEPAPAQQSTPSPAPVQAKAVWADDLTRWQRKALRTFKETGSAVCEFLSENIPYKLLAQIEDALPGCKNEEQIKEVFRGKDMTEQPAPAPAMPQPSGELKALADAINAATQAEREHGTQALILETLKGLRPQAKEDDMQIIINNPANVDVTSRETIEAVKAMAGHFDQLKETVKAAPPPVINVNVPEQAAPQVTVNVPDQPAPQVTVNVPEGPAPVVNNAVTVQPAPVEVNVPRVKRERQKVSRNKDGLISGTETSLEYEE